MDAIWNGTIIDIKFTYIRHMFHNFAFCSYHQLYFNINIGGVKSVEC
jgi:hypothetical protein